MIVFKKRKVLVGCCRIVLLRFTCGVLPLDLLGVGRCYWKRSLTSYLVGEMELATFVGCLEFEFCFVDVNNFAGTKLLHV